MDTNTYTSRGNYSRSCFLSYVDVSIDRALLELTRFAMINSSKHTVQSLFAVLHADGDSTDDRRANRVAYILKLSMRAMRFAAATDLRRRLQHDCRQRVTTTVSMSHLQPTCRGIAYKQVPVVDYTEAEYGCRCTVAASACPLWGIKPRRRSE